MYNGLKTTLIFTLGAAAGSAATWFVLKTKYEKMVQEERETIREYYRKKYEKHSEPTEADLEKAIDTYMDDEDKAEYTEILEDYDGGMNKREKGGSGVMKIGSDPEVIPPDEFGEMDDYDTEYLTYYNDGVLAYDTNNIPIDDIDAVVGYESLEHIGEWEDSILHVRNDRLRTYYEITEDARNYADIM